MMKTTKITTIAALGILSLVSCSKEEYTAPGPGTPDTGRTATVKVSPMSFAGGGLGLEGENDITHMQACLFEGGVMTKVFEDLSSTDAGYQLQVDALDGTLYMLANLDGKIDLNTLLLAGTSEDNFHKTAISMGSDGKTVNFFTGSVALSGPDTYTYTAELKRGVARFDLAVSSTAGQEVSVKKIEITNVAQKGTLSTPAAGIETPADAGRSTASVNFDVPVTDASQGFLYVYEQKNPGMEVKATVEVAGQEKVLTKSLSGDISRNNVYTIKVSKNNIDIYVNVNIADWEDGADTEIEA